MEDASERKKVSPFVTPFWHHRFTLAVLGYGYYTGSLFRKREIKKSKTQDRFSQNLFDLRMRVLSRRLEAPTHRRYDIYIFPECALLRILAERESCAIFHVIVCC